MHSTAKTEKMAISDDERWLMAVTQAKNIATLLEGELSDVYVRDSSGKETRRFIIEFTEKTDD
jgi:hypothetical protein